MGDHGRGRVPKMFLIAHFHASGGKHFQGRQQRGLRQGMGVHAQKERSPEAFRRPVFRQSLSHGEHVGFVETSPERRPPMSRSAKGHPLGGVFGIGAPGVVRRHQAGHVHQHVQGCGFPCQSVHRSPPPFFCSFTFRCVPRSPPGGARPAYAPLHFCRGHRQGLSSGSRGSHRYMSMRLHPTPAMRKQSARFRKRGTPLQGTPMPK